MHSPTDKSVGYSLPSLAGLVAFVCQYVVHSVAHRGNAVNDCEAEKPLSFNVT